MGTIGIIGYGNMGGAFCRGFKERGIEFAVSEKKPDRIAALKAEQGQDSLGLPELLARCSITILAVKPQEAAALLAELKPLAGDKGFISIMAGKPLSFLKGGLQTDKICRFMPNLAALALKAAVAVSFAAGADGSFRAECLGLARSIGEPFAIPEKLMSAFTGLSGSGIAYVFSFLNALALGGVAAGIRFDEALRIALATAEGAVAALRATGAHPQELLSRVISPAGTTIKGIKRLERAGFTGAVMKAVEDAADRAAELER